MATYIVTAKLPNKTEIVYSVVTENMLEKEAITSFKQFQAKHCSVQWPEATR